MIWCIDILFRPEGLTFINSNLSIMFMLLSCLFTEPGSDAMRGRRTGKYTFFFLAPPFIFFFFFALLFRPKTVEISIIDTLDKFEYLVNDSFMYYLTLVFVCIICFRRRFHISYY